MLPLRNQNHNEMAFAVEERMMKEAVRSGGGEIRCSNVWNAQNEFWEWVASGKRSWSLGRGFAKFRLEFWTFEVMVILAGLLPNPKLETSVISISLNTAALVYMIAMGLSAAVSTRVSNELGAGNPQAARLAVCVAVSMTIVEGITLGVILICIRHVWGRAYSNEEDVVKKVAIMLPLLALSHLLDGTQCVLSGTARGCGWQKICAYINLASYYLVGIPTSVVLAFVLHVGIQGLWAGIICALAIQVSLLVIITLRTDWDIEAGYYCLTGKEGQR